jgi:hypothetical protein
MQRTLRVVQITAGLAVAGAVFGALAAAIACAVWLTVDFGAPTAVHELQILAWAGAVGGVLGAALGPAAAWLLLRRVPLGRAVLGATGGAVVGGAGAALAGGFPPGGAVLGLIVAAALLRGAAEAHADVPRLSIRTPAA